MPIINLMVSNTALQMLKVNNDVVTTVDGTGYIIKLTDYTGELRFDLTNELLKRKDAKQSHEDGDAASSAVPTPSESLHAISSESPASVTSSPDEEAAASSAVPTPSESLHAISSESPASVTSSSEASSPSFPAHALPTAGRKRRKQVSYTRSKIVIKVSRLGAQ